MSLTEKENYFMQIANVERVEDIGDEPKFQVFDLNSYKELAQAPVTPIKFASEEKAWNWWFYQCRNSPSIMKAAAHFEKEVAQYRKMKAQ